MIVKVLIACHCSCRWLRGCSKYRNIGLVQRLSILRMSLQPSIGCRTKHSCKSSASRLYLLGDKLDHSDACGVHVTHTRHVGRCQAVASDLNLVLQWTQAEALALLEQNGLALCVELALEMRCTLCSSVQLCRCSGMTCQIDFRVYIACGASCGRTT